MAQKAEVDKKRKQKKQEKKVKKALKKINKKKSKAKRLRNGLLPVCCVCAAGHVHDAVALSQVTTITKSVYPSVPLCYGCNQKKKRRRAARKQMVRRAPWGTQPPR